MNLVLDYWLIEFHQFHFVTIQCKYIKLFCTFSPVKYVRVRESLFFKICNYILYESIYNKELVLLKKQKTV